MVRPSMIRTNRAIIARRGTPVIGSTPAKNLGRLPSTAAAYTTLDIPAVYAFTVEKIMTTAKRDTATPPYGPNTLDIISAKGVTPPPEAYAPVPTTVKATAK